MDNTMGDQTGIHKMHIKKIDHGFQVVSQTYRFSFDAPRLAAELASPSEGGGLFTFNAVPTLDEKPIDGLSAGGVLIADDRAEIDLTAPGLDLSLEFTFSEQSIAFCYRLSRGGGLERFSPGSITGSFTQVRNFDPDIARFDIPHRIKVPVQISSKRIEYKLFYQMDQGNYMIPPYLLALESAGGFLGLGLLEVPNLTIPMDATVSIADVRLNFDYTDKQTTPYQTPMTVLMLGKTDEHILSAYRQAVRAHLPTGTKSPLPPKWWKDPIYTTWGDQVYAKFVQRGGFTSEAGAEDFLTADLVDNALSRLAEQSVFPRTIVLDEGWARSLGDWDCPADERFGRPVAGFIAEKQRLGYHILLHFNPFLVQTDSRLACEHPQLLICDQAGKPQAVKRSGREYFMPDWSRPALRQLAEGWITNMLGPQGLNADGLKVSGTKFIPVSPAGPADGGLGLGERYLFGVLQLVGKLARSAKPDAPISLACLNPLMAECFDIVRLGNISEVNHDLYVKRAHTASRLMPDKPIDTDDWACYRKAVGTSIFLKVLAGVPNLFSSRFRGDGRYKNQGAPGGHPVSITTEQYKVIASAWKLYELSRLIDRSGFQADFDRMEFSAGGTSRGGLIKTYNGGSVLAVYGDKTIWLASLQNSPVIIDLPAGWSIDGIEQLTFKNTRQAVPFTPCLGDKVLLQASSCRQDAFYYQINCK